MKTPEQKLQISESKPQMPSTGVGRTSCFQNQMPWLSTNQGPAKIHKIIDQPIAPGVSKYNTSPGFNTSSSLASWNCCCKTRCKAFNNPAATKPEANTNTIILIWALKLLTPYLPYSTQHQSKASAVPCLMVRFGTVAWAEMLDRIRKLRGNNGKYGRRDSSFNG